MHKRITVAEERALGERLRREALESWPAYSEPLHDRIISAVERRRREEAVVPRAAPGAMRWRSLLATACTAAGLLCAVALGWRTVQRESVKENVERTEVVFANGGSQRADDAAKTSSVPVAPVVAPSPSTAAEATFASLPLIDELAKSAVDNLDSVIGAAVVAPQSANLKHDTRLAAEVLLRRLPVDVESFAGP